MLKKKLTKDAILSDFDLVLDLRGAESSVNCMQHFTSLVSRSSAVDVTVDDASVGRHVRLQSVREFVRVFRCIRSRVTMKKRGKNCQDRSFRSLNDIQIVFDSGRKFDFGIKRSTYTFINRGYDFDSSKSGGKINFTLFSPFATSILTIGRRRVASFVLRYRFSSQSYRNLWSALKIRTVNGSGPEQDNA